MTTCVLQEILRAQRGEEIAQARDFQRRPCLPRILLPSVMHTHVVGPDFQGEKTSIVLIFDSVIYLFIHLYLNTCFLHYKGVLAFNFERNGYHYCFLELSF